MYQSIKTFKFLAELFLFRIRFFSHQFEKDNEYHEFKKKTKS